MTDIILRFSMAPADMMEFSSHARKVHHKMSPHRPTPTSPACPFSFLFPAGGARPLSHLNFAVVDNRRPTIAYPKKSTSSLLPPSAGQAHEMSQRKKSNSEIPHCIHWTTTKKKEKIECEPFNSQMTQHALILWQFHLCRIPK